MVIARIVRSIIKKSNKDFVISALEIQKRELNSIKKETDLLIVRPSNLLFKVVVNNFKQKEKYFDKEEIVETKIGHHTDSAPKQTGYLKFPDCDWF